MGSETLLVSEVIPASPERIYSAWLDSREHSLFTGSRAEIEPGVGGRHTAFDGYAEGVTLELDPARRIVQTWRTTEFPTGSPDSRIEVTLEPTVGGTTLTIFQTDIPEGQSGSYKSGWLDHYLEPLRRYFGAEEGPAAVETAGPVRTVKARPKTKVKAKTRAKARRPKARKAGRSRKPKKAKAKPKKRATPKAKRRRR